MNLEEQLMVYKQRIQTNVQEKKIQEVIQRSKEAFFDSEQERMLSYHEFLWSQFRLVKKRWWVLQGLVLLLAGAALLSVYKDDYIGRSTGVMAAVFVILIIPELWKNRSYCCMEVEEASYYSLRQIYAARMVLFGIVDVLLLTAFCGTMIMGMHIEFTRLLVQFLLPMLVTACICFGTLCSKYIVNESVAIILCILWCLAWLGITLDEELYQVITLPVWLVCIGIALCFLCIAVWRTLNNCGCYWEVGKDEIRTL